MVLVARRIASPEFREADWRWRTFLRADSLT